MENLVPSNSLYLAVLPIIPLNNESSPTEQVLTLLPDRNLATAFFADEVDWYIDTFKNRSSTLSGGHVTGYVLDQEVEDDGRVYVRVIQNVR